MASIGISDVVTVSVYSEKTCLKKCMMIMIIIGINKSQETTVFHGCQKLTSAMKLAKARKVMVDFKFDTLYRYISIESLLKSGE